MGPNSLAIIGGRTSFACLPVPAATATSTAARSNLVEAPCARLWTHENGREQNRLTMKTLRNRRSTSSCAVASDGHFVTISSENVMWLAREHFRQEVASSDEDISLAEVALLIAAEDEAFLSADREKDVIAVQKEGRTPRVAAPQKAVGCGVGVLPLGGLTITEWLIKINHLSSQAKAHLFSNGCDHSSVEILKAVHAAIFEVHGFTRRTYLSTDVRSSYLHLVMDHGSGTAVMLSILFIEVCKELGLRMQATALGERFVTWATVAGEQMSFEPWEGLKCLFSENDPKVPQSRRSFVVNLNLSCEKILEPASNRDILGIALQNLKRIHWKQATRACPGLSIDSPLHPMVSIRSRPVNEPLLRPRELRLALSASERLLILHPRNWNLRKDHGLLLYHSRRFGEAVQELSIYMAFAPAQEMELLGPFVEKLHLMRFEAKWSLWNPLNNPPAMA